MLMHSILIPLYCNQLYSSIYAFPTGPAITNGHCNGLWSTCTESATSLTQAQGLLLCKC